MITVIVNFSDDSSLTVRNAAYVPNIGDAVHNENDKLYRYFITRKDIYYNGVDVPMTIILSATKPISNEYIC